MVVLPLNDEMQMYLQCCGKIVCCGCILAHQATFWESNDRADESAVSTCPFCRRPTPDSQEKVFEGIMGRVESGDARAIYQLATHYEDGDFGLPVDRAKALELLQQAADLGCIEANSRLGNRYRDGSDGLRKDLHKARLYWEFATKKGDVGAQHNLGWMECRNGNMDLGIRHLRISAQFGNKQSVDSLREIAKLGYLREEDLLEAENAFWEALEATKTEDRDIYFEFHICPKQTAT